jgi:hypothetical protein
MIILNIPIIPEKNQREGYLSKLLPKMDYVPRIGEQVYVTEELTLEVKSVMYSGHWLNSVAITLEAIAMSDNEIQKLEKRITDKKTPKWTYNLKRTFVDPDRGMW